MTTGSDYFEQLKREARLLDAVGDWRGLRDVLDDLAPCFRGAPWAALAFFREMVRENNKLRREET